MGLENRDCQTRPKSRKLCLTPHSPTPELVDDGPHAKGILPELRSVKKANSYQLNADASFFWDDLLEYIDEQRVAPILGPELLRVSQDGGEALLHRCLAEKLARKLNVPADNLPAAQPLNHVVCRFLESAGQREDIHSRLRTVMKEVKPPTLEPLRKLARIRHLNLYVSTTFDPLLEQALNEERFAGAAKTQSLAYAPNNVQDLPSTMEQLNRPVVFQLLGRLSASPDCAITEEDTLEFLGSLQVEAKRPHSRKRC